ncbi:MAG: aldo/keto reductase [Planctomycetota bacterium]|nr:aldo/keto reductase [Planctomycetota bacterium]
MKTRLFHSNQTQVSEVGIGTWQLGGSEWGEVSETQAIETLNAAAEAGVTLIDTADIYGLGRSEQLIGRFLNERSDSERFTVITKFGRGPSPGWPDNFHAETLIAHAEASLARLGVEALDLTQTHCIPDDYLTDGTVWQVLRDLKSAGKIKAFGASVESMAEAIDCLNVEGLSSLQIIFNVFRQKPLDDLFERAAEKQIDLIIRLPLASGLLTGKFTVDTQFDPSDHRHFNCDGDAFNVGETFAGLGLTKGVELADQLKPLVPENTSMAQWALRWCLDFPEVTSIIPGATRPEQAKANADASRLPSLSASDHQTLKQFYRTDVAEFIRGKY